MSERSVHGVGVLADTRVWTLRKVEDAWPQQMIDLANSRPPGVAAISPAGIAATGAVWGTATDTVGRKRPAVWFPRDEPDGTVTYHFSYIRDLLPSYLSLDLTACHGIGPAGEIIVSGYDHPKFQIYRLVPLLDTDHDGMPDAWESAHGTNLGLADAEVDQDSDGLDQLSEYLAGTDPLRLDTDGDGLPDGWELQRGYNPRDPRDAGWDLDGDRLTALQEFRAQTDPTVRYDVVELSPLLGSSGLDFTTLNSPAPGLPLTLAGGYAAASDHYYLGFRLRLSDDPAPPLVTWLPGFIPVSVAADGTLAGTYYQYLPSAMRDTGTACLFPATASELGQRLPVDLGFAGESFALSLSPFGDQLAGLYYPPPTYLQHGFTWMPGALAGEVLPLPGVQVGHLAFGGDGQIFGSYLDGTTTPWHSFSRVGPSFSFIEQLPELAGFVTTITHAVNAGGDVLFSGYPPDYAPGADAAFVLLAGTPRRVSPIPGLGRQNTGPTAMNARRQIVGSTYTASGIVHGYISAETVPGSGTWHTIDLNALSNSPRFEITHAFAINERGEILVRALDLASGNQSSVSLLLRPRSQDSDGNGLLDEWEIRYFGATGVDPAADLDRDGLSNAQELAHGTNPLRGDTDGDGLSDPEELALGTDPNEADTDADGVPDGEDAFPLIKGASRIFGTKQYADIDMSRILGLIDERITSTAVDDESRIGVIVRSIGSWRTISWKDGTSQSSPSRPLSHYFDYDGGILYDPEMVNAAGSSIVKAWGYEYWTTPRNLGIQVLALNDGLDQNDFCVDEVAWCLTSTGAVWKTDWTGFQLLNEGYAGYSCAGGDAIYANCFRDSAPASVIRLEGYARSIFPLSDATVCSAYGKFAFGVRNRWSPTPPPSHPDLAAGTLQPFYVDGDEVKNFLLDLIPQGIRKQIRFSPNAAYFYNTRYNAMNSAGDVIFFADVWEGGDWHPRQLLFERKTRKVIGISYEADLFRTDGTSFNKNHWMVNQGHLFLPVELQTRNPEKKTVEPSEGIVAPADPKPEVDMRLVSTRFNSSGALEIAVEGTVKDRLSEVFEDVTKRVRKLHFKINGADLDDPIDLQYGPGDPPFTVADSETSFTHTFIIPNPRPGGYFVMAETEENAVGNRGWARIAVGLAIEPVTTNVPGTSGPLSIAFPQGATGANAGFAIVYFGNRAPAAGDGTVTATAAHDGTFTGNIKVGGQSVACTLRLRGPSSFSSSTVEHLDAQLSFALPNQGQQTITLSAVESAGDSQQFTGDGYQITGEELVVKRTQELPGSQRESFEPLVMRIGIPEAWAENSNLNIKINGQDHTVKSFTYGDSSSTYVVATADDTRAKVIVPSLKTLPAEHTVGGAREEGDRIAYTLNLNGYETDLAEVQVVGHSEEEAPAPPLPPPTGPGWHKPGDEITRDDLLTAYKFIYPDELSQLILNVFLEEEAAGRAELRLKNEIGDYAFNSHWLGGFTIDIEKNDSDVHPGIAAQYLHMGLNQALAVRSFRRVVQEAAAYQSDELLLSALAAWRAQVGPAAAEAGVAAAELYLSGISIALPETGWVFVVDELSKGHLTALAAAVPFIPKGILSGGRKLILKGRSGQVLEEFADVSKLEAVRKVSFVDKDLRTMGVTIEGAQLNEFLRKVLSGNGGPIPLPKARNGLRKAMMKAGPMPQLKAIAHHDFLWSERLWFSQHGIDVNNPAFGRWVSKNDHKFWHERAVPKIDDFWKDIIRKEKDNIRLGGEPLTIEEILQKLVECRSQYPVMNGN